MSNLDPEQAVYEFGIMEDRYEVWSSFEKLLNLLMVSFATVSLFLAALGLYGTLAFLVSERTREVGVRMSLGADRVRIFRMITAKGVTLVLGGLVLGSIAGVAVNHVLANLGSVWTADSRLLFQAKDLDVSIFAVVGLLLLLIGFLACAIPALRAARLDPNRALRYE